MTDPTNYWLAWIFYLTAAAVFYAVFWWLTDFRQRRVMTYCLRAVMLALIATPWYVSGDEALLAPALVIVLMDAITISGAAAVRAFVPLFLSVIMSLVAALVLMLVRRGVRPTAGKNGT